MFRIKSVIIASLLAGYGSVYGQQAALVSGPMLGHVDQREASVWIQSTSEATAFVKYWNVNTPENIFQSRAQQTQSSVNTATLVADSVEPGNTYGYDVYLDGVKMDVPYSTNFTTQPNWRWSREPLKDGRIMFGSCLYINESGYERRNSDGSESGYGSEFEILEAMTKARADAMIWLGDNTYLREPDWNSRSGVIKRYSHTRAFPGLQPLLAAQPNYATWDDHDYGPNNSNRSWWGKDITLAAHKQFWPNPSYGTSEMPGVMTTFEYLDVQVILLDGRWYRSPEDRKDTESEILGQRQTEWLIDMLCTSTATFKVVAVGSQFLTTDTRKESFVHAPKERDRIVSAITENNVSGVIFLSGDVHGAELTQFERAGTYPLFEFTSSSITAGSNKGIADQPNDYRVPETAFGGHNYGVLDLEGASRKDRKLVLRLFDKDGKQIWEHELRAEDLQ